MAVREHESVLGLDTIEFLIAQPRPDLAPARPASRRAASSPSRAPAPRTAPRGLVLATKSRSVD